MNHKPTARPGTIDVELSPLIDQLGLGARPLFDLDQVADARATMAMLAGAGRQAMPADGAIDIATVAVPRGDGTELDLRIVRPSAGKPLAGTLLWCHGGGYVMGGAADEDPLARELVLAFDLAVVTFDYRLAPEHAYPAAHDDARSAWAWLVGEGAATSALQGPFLLGGFSAGGGLAAGLVLRLRDDGERLPTAVLLDAPMLDDGNTAPLEGEDGGTGIWNARSNFVAWGYYLGSGAPDAYAAPIRAESLAGLPPVYLMVGGADYFRDEGLAFASRLAATGNATELHLLPGGCHGFPGLLPQAGISQAARESRYGFLRRMLAPTR